MQLSICRRVFPSHERFQGRQTRPSPHCSSGQAPDCRAPLEHMHTNRRESVKWERQWKNAQHPYHDMRSEPV